MRSLPTLPRPATASVLLLADHLDAALAAGEDMRAVRYRWSGEALPCAAEDIDALRAGRREAVERLRTLELALLSRLLKAREGILALALEEDRFAALARLYLAGTAVLQDAVAECADLSEEDFDTGDDLTAYFRSRGLIAEDAPGLPDASPIAIDDAFLVARRVRLGVLLDLVASFLDALEAQFDLYEAGGGGPALSLPAAPPH
jgi:hypothetical protein